jgi:hypothetical protein
MSFETVPGEPATTIWAGELVPRPDLEDSGERGLLQRRLQPEDVESDLPIVSIGQPEVLRSVRSLETPGFEDLVAKDFYLLRLWCSFRDFDKEIVFSRAHFKLSLLAPDGGESPLTAHEMYPSEVLHKVKRDVRVALTPELKFAEVGAKVGSFEYGFTYTELQPQIVAAGQGESTPSWTFSKTKSRRLQGGKAMHLLVAAPQGTQQAEADLELSQRTLQSQASSRCRWGCSRSRGRLPPPN